MRQSGWDPVLQRGCGIQITGAGGMSRIELRHFEGGDRSVADFQRV